MNSNRIESQGDFSNLDDTSKYVSWWSDKKKLKNKQRLNELVMNHRNFTALYSSVYKKMKTVCSLSATVS